MESFVTRISRGYSRFYKRKKEYHGQERQGEKRQAHDEEKGGQEQPETEETVHLRRLGVRTGRQETEKNLLITRFLSMTKGVLHPRERLSFEKKPSNRTQGHRKIKLIKQENITSLSADPHYEEAAKEENTTI